MSLFVVGTNHKFSPVELRERIYFPKRRVKDALSFLLSGGTLSGAVILSTCNRIEIYAHAGNTSAGKGEVEDFISRYHEIDKERILPYLYRYEDCAAVKHLCAVTAGLDSLILGESQIAGQVRNAFGEAERHGFVNSPLKRTFHAALSIAKKVQRETKIAEGKVSVGSVAIDLIKDSIGSLAGKNILVIGVGKVTELVLRYLKKEEPHVVFLSNRTAEKAQELAGRIGATFVRFDRMKEHLPNADAIITATASPHFIIRKETVQENTGPHLTIIDLAMPRDVDPRVRELANVDLFYLDDLDSVIRRAIERKTGEAKKAGLLIEAAVRKLEKKTFRVGARSSPLALRQADEVIAAVKKSDPDLETEIIRIDTYGDRDRATPLSAVEGSDFFTREIEEALLRGDIDCAVHSAKDMPETLPEGLAVAAITEPADRHDALVSRDGLKLDELPRGARIGTSSIRRKEALKKYRADFKVVDIRGTIEERLALLDHTDPRTAIHNPRNLDAIVIAAVGLTRLGLEHRITQRIPFDIMQPHPFQGALAVEVKRGRADLMELFRPLDTRKEEALYGKSKS